MDRHQIIAGILALIIGVFVLIRFLFPEDNWVCQNGQWIRHGNPSAPQPTSVCPVYR